MTSYRHPDLDRPVVSLSQLKALESMIRRYLADDAQLTDLEVLATAANAGNPAPLEVRARIAVPVGGSERPWSGSGLVQEVRAGWPPTDFLFSLYMIEGPHDPDVPSGLVA